MEIHRERIHLHENELRFGWRYVYIVRFKLLNFVFIRSKLFDLKLSWHLNDLISDG